MCHIFNTFFCLITLPPISSRKKMIEETNIQSQQNQQHQQMTACKQLCPKCHGFLTNVLKFKSVLDDKDQVQKIEKLLNVDAYCLEMSTNDRSDCLIAFLKFLVFGFSEKFCGQIMNHIFENGFTINSSSTSICTLNSNDFCHAHKLSSTPALQTFSISDTLMFLSCILNMDYEFYLKFKNDYFFNFAVGAIAVTTTTERKFFWEKSVIKWLEVENVLGNLFTNEVIHTNKIVQHLFHGFKNSHSFFVKFLIVLENIRVSKQNFNKNHNYIDWNMHISQLIPDVDKVMMAQKQHHHLQMDISDFEYFTEMLLVSGQEFNLKHSKNSDSEDSDAVALAMIDASASNEKQVKTIIDHLIQIHMNHHSDSEKDCQRSIIQSAVMGYKQLQTFINNLLSINAIDVKVGSSDEDRKAFLKCLLNLCCCSPSPLLFDIMSLRFLPSDTPETLKVPWVMMAFHLVLMLPDVMCDIDALQIWWRENKAIILKHHQSHFFMKEIVMLSGSVKKVKWMHVKDKCHRFTKNASKLGLLHSTYYFDHRKLASAIGEFRLIPDNFYGKTIIGWSKDKSQPYPYIGLWLLQNGIVFESDEKSYKRSYNIYLLRQVFREYSGFIGH